MIECLETIIIPYVESYREFLSNSDQFAVVIMDNFKGQVMSTINDLTIFAYVCLILANTTNLLQPMDVAVNKATKLKSKIFNSGKAIR